MQGGPSLSIGRIDSILNPLILLPVCPQFVEESFFVANVAGVVSSLLLLVFPSPSIILTVRKVLDRDTVRIITRLQVRSGFE